MKKLVILMMLVGLITLLIQGQVVVGGPGAGTITQTGNGAPSGNCPATNYIYVNTANGDTYSCPNPNSTWVKISGGGGAAGLTPLPVVDYQMPSTEVSTTTLTDYSGNNNNGTFPGGGANPTRIAGTGGLATVTASSQYINMPAAVNNCTSFLFAYNYQIANNFASLGATGDIAFLSQKTLQGGGTVFAVGLHHAAGPNNIGSSNNFNDIFMGLLDYSGGSGSTMAHSPGQGTHVFVSSSSNVNGQQDAIYLDGVQMTNITLGPATTGGSARFAPGASGYALGGANVAWPNFGTVNYYRFACWSGALTTAQVAQDTQAALTALNQEGVVAPSVGVNSVPAGGSGNDVFVADGDSVTNGALAVGTPGIKVYLSNLQLGGNSYTVWSAGQTGIQLTPTLLNNTGFFDNFLNLAASRNVFYEQGGKNDTSGVVASEGSLASIGRQKRAKGWKYLVGTMVAGGSQAVNTWTRQHWSEFADGVVDLGGDPTIGGNQIANLADNVHPTCAQDQNIMGYYLQRAINRLYGAHDFTSATSYTSAVAAATTVTASSDGASLGCPGVGTSIATYTFASNPFTVGQEVTCSGITPAGYNATFFVLSSNATQITGLIASSALGVGTVFGSCIAPQIEDAVFTINNAGAQAYSLGTACGYTGQMVTFKNVGAGTGTFSTTAMPGEAAETFDGNATMTATQNQTRSIQSINTSSSTTPQCNWKVVQ